MEVFIITQAGGFTENKILEVYSTLKLAKARAYELTQQDEEHLHCFRICVGILDSGEKVSYRDYVYTKEDEMKPDVKNENVFIVIRRGVYRHEVLGVYTTFEKATIRARNLAKEDEDSWHDYIIGMATINMDIDDILVNPTSYCKSDFKKIDHITEISIPIKED